MNVDEYLELFIEESEEHIQVLSDQMMELEREPRNLEVVTLMFRAAHTLKGMAGSMGFEKMQKLTHHIENKMDDIRNKKTSVDEKIIEFMFKGVERLETILSEIKENGKEETSIEDLINDTKYNEKTDENNKEIFVYNEIELSALQQAKEDGNNVYKVHFKLKEDCMLKYVRTMMFIKEVENIGEVFKMDKTEEEMETDENYNGSLNVVLVTKVDSTQIESLIDRLSEVEKIEVKAVDVSNETTQPLKPSLEKTETLNNSNQSIKKKEQSIRVNLAKLDFLMNMFEELIVEKGSLQTIADKVNHRELKESIDRLNRITDNMQSGLLSTRMVPVDQLFKRFPRMVRATSKELGKKINFIIDGSETELDRTIVDELGDPLIHLIRNSLDHGIEEPEKRKQRGKNETGEIILRAYYSGNEVIIEITDDGNGINLEKIKEKIVKNQLLTIEELELLNDEQIIQYIFSSGLSTSEKVTNLSGRGVGLDVVRSKIQELGGFVKVLSTVGKGSTFRISIPLTLSIIESLLVREDEYKYLIPITNVVEAFSIKKENFKMIDNELFIFYRGVVYPIKTYGGLWGKENRQEKKQGLIVQGMNGHYCLLIDEVVGQREIVLKNLSGYLKQIPGVMGAAFLGDGSVIFVIDVNFFNRGV